VNMRRALLVAGLAASCVTTPVVMSPRAGPDVPAEWCLQQASDGEGGLVFLTTNLAFRSYPRRAEFPFLVEVNVHVVDKNRNGHPTNAEAQVLNALEDDLVGAIAARVPTRYVGRATVPGFRDLIIYVSDDAAANAVLERLAQSPQRREWEYRISEDREWTRALRMIGSDPHCL